MVNANKIQWKNSVEYPATSGIMPKHVPGDLIIIFAYNETGTTPSLPAGYTLIGSTNNGANAETTGYKIATTSSETTGTWTNAHTINISIYSGAAIGNTTNDSGLSEHIITYPTFTLSNTTGSSWITAFYAQNSEYCSTWNIAPDNTFSIRSSRGYWDGMGAAPTIKVGNFDTGKGVASFSEKTFNFDCGGGPGKDWVSRVIELVPAPTSSNYSFSFTIAENDTNTSAGIFKAATGELIRTLWSSKKLNIGTYDEEWDWKNDAGTILTSVDGPFEVKVLKNKVTYNWNGVVGNTSDALSGVEVFRGLRGPCDMAIHNSILYIPMGFPEAQASIIKIDSTTSIYDNRTELLYDVVQADLETIHVDTDGTTVYWAGYDAWDTNNSFCYGTNISGDTEKQFSSGAYAKANHGRVYNWAFDINTVSATAHPSGIAVMKSGNYVFVAHQGQNVIRVFNKTTAAFVRDIAYTTPGKIKITNSDILFVISGTSVYKHSINGDGTINAASVTISGFADPVSIAVSKNNTLVSVLDSGSSQQIKTYNVSDGTSAWTLGQVNGYNTNALVANDKFMFTYAYQGVYFSRPFMEYDTDGSFYVGDPGCQRVLKFNSSRTHLQTLSYMRMHYGIATSQTTPSRIFGDYLQFNRDHSITLGPRNGSWTLTHNWLGQLGADRHSPDFLSTRTRFKNSVTFPNGRVYALVNKYLPTNPSSEVTELKADGTLSYTGVILPTWISNDRAIMLDNGDVVYDTIDHETQGATGYFKVRRFLGFSPEPSWSAEENYNVYPTIANTNPGWQYGKSNAVTSSGKLIVFAPAKTNTGYHLGAVEPGASTYQWQTAPSTINYYSGDLPKGNHFDIGNRVEYAGGDVVAMNTDIFWNYHGEFWKNSQTNIWKHYHESGLMIGEFGKTSLRAVLDEGGDFRAPSEGAGNVFSIGMTQYGDDYYIYHNDESIHSGVHEWQVSGLNTTQEESIIFESTYSVGVDKFDIALSFNAVTFTYSGDSVTGYELSSDPLAVNITFNDVTTLLSGYDLVSTSVNMPITFRQVTFFLNSPPSPNRRKKFNIFRIFTK